ncbi:MAG TPA: hypothetical protein VID47_02315 [Actinomycetota bacterium]|jgi:hypothetical protein
MGDDDRTWNGVLIFEVDARFVSTSEHPASTDPDAEGTRLLAIIEAALKADAAGRPYDVGGIRYAGSRGSTRYG